MILVRNVSYGITSGIEFRGQSPKTHQIIFMFMSYLMTVFNQNPLDICQYYRLKICFFSLNFHFFFNLVKHKITSEPIIPSIFVEYCAFDDDVDAWI